MKMILACVVALLLSVPSLAAEPVIDFNWDDLPVSGDANADAMTKTCLDKYKGKRVRVEGLCLEAASKETRLAWVSVFHPVKRGENTLSVRADALFRDLAPERFPPLVKHAVSIVGTVTDVQPGGKVTLDGESYKVGK